MSVVKSTNAYEQIKLTAVFSISFNVWTCVRATTNQELYHSHT